jgi:rhamnosyltransferase
MGLLKLMDNVAMEPQIYLSVVIRTRNQAKSLKLVLDALNAQRCNFRWEVIVVDNESDDDTVELCQEYKARVIPIRHDEFTYGRAINLGISHAAGTLVLLCSAHSVPIGSYFFESAVAAFTDSNIAAVRCVHNTLNQQLKEWYTGRDIQYSSLEEQKRAEAGTEWISDYPSATCCVIRRSVWEQVPYDEQVEFMEDKLWAAQVLSKGYKIRCRSDAIFIHIRQRGQLEAWRRESRAYRTLYRTTGYIPLRWSRFLVRIVRLALLAPLVAIRYFVQNVVSDACVVTVPWQATFAPRRGSKPEYDIPALSRLLSKFLDKTTRRP